jgi:hypothetical protein
VPIFTQIEKDHMKKDFTCNISERYNRNCESDFTEYGFETSASIKDELNKNNSEKSIILAPFNSTKTHLSLSLQDSVKELIVRKKIVKFHAKVKELDRQYEKNNNCELDNGVYNKAVDEDSDAGGELGLTGIKEEKSKNVPKPPETDKQFAEDNIAVQ